MTANVLSDFDWGLTRLRVRKTGAVLRYDAALARDVASHVRFMAAVVAAKPLEGPPFTVAFLPDPARPWYLVWSAVRLAGGRVTSRPERADVVIQFEDASVSAPLAGPPGAIVLNGGAVDVRKSAVGRAFETAFGYPLALDPRVHRGPAVEKSELNGAHDGRIVTCPAEPRLGSVYQRVIDNRCPGKPHWVEDLRAPTVGGRPILVYRKRRPVESRFANMNTEVVLARVEDVLSGEELAAIERFCGLLGLDWGGLDILRDQDGRVYIVDANKTDMGPPIALPFEEKMESATLLAGALRQYVMARRAGES